MLRMPDSVPLVVKRNRVRTVMEELGLLDVKGSIIKTNKVQHIQQWRRAQTVMHRHRAGVKPLDLDPGRAHEGFARHVCIEYHDHRFLCCGCHDGNHGSSARDSSQASMSNVLLHLPKGL